MVWRLFLAKAIPEAPREATRFFANLTYYANQLLKLARTAPIFSKKSRGGKYGVISD